MEPDEAIMIFYNLIIPGKQNATILAFKSLLIILNTPFYTVIETTSPTSFLEAIYKN